MGYQDKKFAIAEGLWEETGMFERKGSLLNDFEIVEQRGLSSGEQVIFDLCTAMIESERKLPALTDIAFYLNNSQKAVVLKAISELISDH